MARSRICLESVSTTHDFISLLENRRTRGDFVSFIFERRKKFSHPFFILLFSRKEVENFLYLLFLADSFRLICSLFVPAYARTILFVLNNTGFVDSRELSRISSFDRITYMAYDFHTPRYTRETCREMMEQS